MRIGIFGGSFDPIHYGHLILADRCGEELRLDKVLFVPAAVSPLKSSGPAASDAARLEMLSLALGGNDAFEISRCEIDRSGISYTLDTVTEIRSIYPRAELFLLMGADLVSQLDSWKQPGEIFAVAAPVILNRAGHGSATLDDLKPFLKSSRRDDAQFLSMPQIEISSSSLRDRVATGRSIRYQLPPAVEQYIRAHQIYVAH